MWRHGLAINCPRFGLATHFPHIADMKQLIPQVCQKCYMEANPQPCDMLQIHSLTYFPKPFIQVVPGQSCQAPVEYYLSDVISNTLFSLWHAHHAPNEHVGRVGHVFVFPLVTPDNKFDFLQHMKECEHKRACQLVVDTLGRLRNKVG